MGECGSVNCSQFAVNVFVQLAYFKSLPIWLPSFTFPAIGADVSIITPSLVSSENRPALVKTLTINVTLEPSSMLSKPLCALVLRFAVVNGISSMVLFVTNEVTRAFHSYLLTLCLACTPPQFTCSNSEA